MNIEDSNRENSSSAIRRRGLALVFLLAAIYRRYQNTEGVVPKTLHSGGLLAAQQAAWRVFVGHPRRFKELFRIERVLFDRLVHWLSDSADLEGIRYQYRQQKVTVFLWILAHNESQRNAVYVFGISQSSVFSLFHVMLPMFVALHRRLVRQPEDDWVDPIIELDPKLNAFIVDRIPAHFPIPTQNFHGGAAAVDPADNGVADKPDKILPARTEFFFKPRAIEFMPPPVAIAVLVLTPIPRTCAIVSFFGTLEVAQHEATQDHMEGHPTRPYLPRVSRCASPESRRTWNKEYPQLTTRDGKQIVLSRTQRRLPTQIRSGFKISRIRAFYTRKVKFTAETFAAKFADILTSFPRLDVCPFEQTLRRGWLS